jgi:hypothetical protein
MPYGRLNGEMRAKARTNAAEPRGRTVPPASRTRGEPAYSLARPRLLRVGEGPDAVTVMIGPVRGPEHLELIRREAFYHVPVSAIAAARTAVTHIAFYEPASRFGVPGAIRAYAVVRGVSRVRRVDLPGVTWPGRGGPEAVYYRFDLGPLLPLAHPIWNPEHRRVVFRFADLERVRAAETLAALGRASHRTARPRGKP